MAKSVFVTVGSTKFDKLIEAVDQLEVAQALIDMKYSELIVQKGKGSYKFKNLIESGEQETILDNGLKVKCFDYVPSVADIVQKAELVICHAGAGSIFEGLRANKRLIVVPNDLLMNNHQIEIAGQLERMGHLISATPETLLQKLKDSHHFTPLPYVPSNPSKIIQSIDRLFPRSSKND